MHDNDWVNDVVYGHLKPSMTTIDSWLYGMVNERPSSAVFQLTPCRHSFMWMATTTSLRSHLSDRPFNHRDLDWPPSQTSIHSFDHRSIHIFTSRKRQWNRTPNRETGRGRKNGSCLRFLSGNLVHLAFFEDIMLHHILLHRMIIIHEGRYLDQCLLCRFSLFLWIIEL